MAITDTKKWAALATFLGLIVSAGWAWNHVKAVWAEAHEAYADVRHKHEEYLTEQSYKGHEQASKIDDQFFKIQELKIDNAPESKISLNRGRLQGLCVAYRQMSGRNHDRCE